MRIIKIWVEVWVYSVGGNSLFLAGKGTTFNKTLIKILMPILFREYWYMSTYIVLYFFVPYINKIIDNIDKK